LCTIYVLYCKNGYRFLVRENIILTEDYFISYDFSYAFFRCLSAVFRDNKLLAGVERLPGHPPLVGAVVLPIPEAISQL
jgi:hypothetical protein